MGKEQKNSNDDNRVVSDYTIINRKNIEELLEELQYMDSFLINKLQETQREVAKTLSDIKSEAELYQKTSRGLEFTLYELRNIKNEIKEVSADFKNDSMLLEEHFKKLLSSLTLKEKEKQISKSISSISLKYDMLGREVSDMLEALYREKRYVKPPLLFILAIFSFLLGFALAIYLATTQSDFIAPLVNFFS